MEISIVLIHTKKGFLPKTVQKFQMKADIQSGKYNHSGIRVQFGTTDIIFEAAPKHFDEIHGKLKNAGLYFNDFNNYLNNSNYEIMEYTIPVDLDMDEVLTQLMKWEGTPYDFGNLLVQQPFFYKFEKWIGKTPKAAKKTMVCHEATMSVMNEIFTAHGYFYKLDILPAEQLMFHRPHQAQVMDIYYKDWYNQKI